MKVDKCGEVTLIVGRLFCALDFLDDDASEVELLWIQRVGEAAGLTSR